MHLRNSIDNILHLQNLIDLVTLMQSYRNAFSALTCNLKLLAFKTFLSLAVVPSLALPVIIIFAKKKNF